MSNTIYISTTLPYANEVPHVGHALEFVQADAYSRYFRKKHGKENVFFAENAFENFELHDAVSVINDMVSFGNRYFHEKEPWKQGSKDAEIILNNGAYLIQTASELYEPIIPEGAGKAITALEKREKIILFPRI